MRFNRGMIRLFLGVVHLWHGRGVLGLQVELADKLARSHKRSLLLQDRCGYPPVKTGYES